MNWRPIDTAPKDGAEVLVYASFAGEPKCMIASWLRPYGAWVLFGMGIVITLNPTFWMPLPEPPQEGEGDGTNN